MLLTGGIVAQIIAKNHPDVVEGLCNAMMTLLTREYELHMADFLMLKLLLKRIDVP